MGDLPSHPLHEQVQCVMDEMGFVLFDRTTPSTLEGGHPSIDRFGPYCVEQYLIMELLSKQEIAHNVLDYYVQGFHLLALRRPSADCILTACRDRPQISPRVLRRT